MKLEERSFKSFLQILQYISRYILEYCRLIEYEAQVA